MKLTNGRKFEIELAKYFMAECDRHITITPEDEIKYIEYTEKGLHKSELSFESRINRNGFLALCEGKRHAGIMMGQYEQGILDCSVPLVEILKNEDGTPIPRSIAVFISKELFQGYRKDYIMNVYDNICEVGNPDLNSIWEKRFALA